MRALMCSKWLSQYWVTVSLSLELAVFSPNAIYCSDSLKTLACSMPYFSYRSTFELPTGEWQRIRIPWSEFVGKGVEYPFASSELTRVGIVAIGKEMSHVILAISDFRFYNNVRP